MSIGSISSQASITGLDNLSGTNSTQGIYKGHTISAGNEMLINTSSTNFDSPTTSLSARKATIPH